MLKTEMRNPATKHFDKMKTVEMLRIMNEENITDLAKNNALQLLESCS